jgi:hypothetical protein
LNRIGIQSPWWLQIKTVTHISENHIDLQSGAGSLPSQEQARIGYQDFPIQDRLSQGNLSLVLLPASTRTMTLTDPNTMNYSIPSKFSDANLEELCCHRLYQPR